MRILLSEDDAMIGDAVQRGLRQHGFVVDWVRDGLQAEQALALEQLRTAAARPRAAAATGARPAQVAAQSRRRPAGDDHHGARRGDRSRCGSRCRCRRLRRQAVRPRTELAARIRALLRRRSGRAGNTLEHQGVTLDPATRTVTRDGAPRRGVGARVRAAARAHGASRADPVESAARGQRLYGWGEEVESNVVEVYVHSLRRKLGADFIRTVRGVGYRLGAGS